MSGDHRGFKTVYHGQDMEDAIRRAKKISGQVIYSWKDKERSEWGYWSEPTSIAGGFLRNGETQIWPEER